MPNVDYYDVARVAREAVPGETVEARIVDGEGVVVSVEPGCGEGGENLWRVSYVAFVADEPWEESPEDRANGPGPRWRAEVTYQQEHEDAYEAGKEAEELMTHLPKAPPGPTTPWAAGRGRNVSSKRFARGRGASSSRNSRMRPGG